MHAKVLGIEMMFSPFQLIRNDCSLILIYAMVNLFRKLCFRHGKNSETRGAWWLSGRALYSGARGRGFETYLRRVVSLSKTLYSPKVLVIPRKCWLRADMTEKLFNGTLNLNTKNNKTKTVRLCPLPLLSYS